MRMKIMKMKKKEKILCALLCIALSVSMLSGCAAGQDASSDDVNMPDTDVQDAGKEPQNPTGKKVAVAMPDEPDGRWAKDAECMKKELEANGYAVDIQYAADGAQQAAQLAEFVTAKADCIVLTAIDSAALTDAGAAAMQAGIPIIAYGRLFMDTEAVSFYTAFDHKGVGITIGKAIVEKAGLDNLTDGEYKTIEFFMGAADDHNAYLLYEGLMEVLRPYLDNGSLECKSGSTSFEAASMPECSKEAAQERCKNYLAGYYVQEELDICATAFDSLSYGCKAALQAAGYIEDNWPVISGQDCEVQACRDILDGTQAFSVYKDINVLALKCAAMADAVISGMEPEINDMENYDNHVLTVPAYLCTPVMVDKDNLQETIIDGSYYTKEQIDAGR